MTSTREQLKEAYRLIRQDQPEAAQQILRPILDQDPENVHAWWLLAYSVDDPYEVRDALNKVLELDPNYSNAPKAREMLETLEQQFFSAQEQPAESVTDEDEADSFLSDTFNYDEEADAGDARETPDDAFFAEDEDSFAPGYGDPAFDDVLTGEEFYSEAEEDEAPEDQALDDMFGALGDAALTEDEKAEVEERAGARAGRGRRIVTALLFIAVLVAIVFAAFLLLQDTDSTGEDPGALQALAVESEAVDQVVLAARENIIAAGVGQAQDALVAETKLGRTLFIQFCREPARELPQDIAVAMHLVAQHVVNAGDDLDAAGVSINRCAAQNHDTLYRAFFTVEDATRYLETAPEGETAWAEFQRSWQKP